MSHVHAQSPKRHREPGLHVFTYGSLVDPRCLDEVLGHAHRGERLAARLSGFQRITGRYPYPFVVARPGQHVDGVLVMDLSPRDVQILDAYEEVDAGVYDRELVEVEALGCGSRRARLPAYVYVGGPALKASSSTGG